MRRLKHWLHQLGSIALLALVFAFASLSQYLKYQHEHGLYRTIGKVSSTTEFIIFVVIPAVIFASVSYLFLRKDLKKSRDT